MKYLEFTFHSTPASEIINDVLSATLGEVGFDSFVNEEESLLKAYIKKDAWNEASLETALDHFPLDGVIIDYSYVDAEDKNWNEEWEKNFFEPIVVNDRCAIHCTFHKDVPKAEYDIIIDPRMSFGTGHHATTSLIIKELLEYNLEGKYVLDMGCGTSILAILARMRGATECVAIDNDEWCVSNSLENIELNKMDNIHVSLGDASSLKGKGSFDIIIANINRNILLEDMKYYTPCMKKGSVLFMSGFYTEDVPMIRAEAERLGLHFVHTNEQNHWADVMFEMK